MDILVDNRQDKVNIDENIISNIEKAIKEVLLLEGKSLDYEVSVSFVDNEEIKELNRTYRNVDRETDVLSFPLGEDELFPSNLLGDIVISAEKALEQSQEYGHSLLREIVYLTVHSMFHLLGYDHMEEEEKEIMRSREKKAMKNLQIFKNEREDFQEDEKI